MKVLSLRTELETLLSGMLGTYTLANGYRTPAISVRADGVTLPAYTSVTGLEVVIAEEPSLRPIRQYRNEQAFSVWTVDLLQWGDLATDDALSRVAALLLYSYPGSNLSKPQVSANTGVRARQRLEIVTNPDPDSL